jgi:hypothetical protein
LLSYTNLHRHSNPVQIFVVVSFDPEIFLPKKGTVLTPFFYRVYFATMLSGSLVTTAWRVLRLRMEETASRYGG